MSADHEARSALRQALIAYMRGEIRTFDFDDINTRCIDANDASLVALARTLWLFHDDLLNHRVSVSPEGWDVLRRIVAFLATDLAPEPAGNSRPVSWPFHDTAEWAAHEHLSRDCGLPDYDPEIHGRRIHPWWSQIPTAVGIGLIAASIALMFAIAVLTACR